MQGGGGFDTRWGSAPALLRNRAEIMSGRVPTFPHVGTRHTGKVFIIAQIHYLTEHRASSPHPPSSALLLNRARAGDHSPPLHVDCAALPVAARLAEAGRTAPAGTGPAWRSWCAPAAASRGRGVEDLVVRGSPTGGREPRTDPRPRPSSPGPAFTHADTFGSVSF